MKPLLKDDRNPAAGVVNAGDLILWIASRQAQAIFCFDHLKP